MEAGALRAPAALNRISVTAPLLRLRTDDQLVVIFRSGNDAAFNVIHDRYRQRLFAYSRQMLGGSRQDAEDALQDVFLRAYSSLRAHDRPLSLRAWLYRVAHNRCIDQLRKPAPHAVDLFDTSRKPLRDPMDEVERREDLRRLIADVRRLPDQQRSALLMREIDGLSYAELADALGISLQAVKSLLVRARIGLVEAVEARDTACAEIRLNLADSFDRGVRASGLTRRHLRDCDGCVQYRAQLRGVRGGLSVLAPASTGPFTALLKLAGLGGAGSAGAVSAGGAAAGGGAVTAAGTTTAAKVAALVSCAALTAGGAVEVREQITHRSAPEATSGSKKAVAPDATPGAAKPALVARATAASSPTAVPKRVSVQERSAVVSVTATAGRHQRLAPSHGGAAAPLGAPVAEAGHRATGGATAPRENPSAGQPGTRPAADAGKPQLGPNQATDTPAGATAGSHAAGTTATTSATTNLPGADPSKKPAGAGKTFAGSPAAVSATAASGSTAP
ncbi:MAG: sigma-70 family RNA polymerase sigma factor [Solirubrobacteraceae bacterium]